MYFFFFFSSRRRHTRLQGDWSSDVCSSDLLTRTAHAAAHQIRDAERPSQGCRIVGRRPTKASYGVPGLHRETLDPAEPRYDCFGEAVGRSEEHTSELQSPCNLVCRLLLEKKKKRPMNRTTS